MDVKTNTLTVEWGAVQRRPLLIAGDLIIDGVPLLHQVERATGTAYDLASPIGWMPKHYLSEYAQRLQAESPSVMQSKRYEVLVCPECGDLDCGCISCVVHRDGDFVIWSELGWEADCDLARQIRFPMGQFRFRADKMANLLGFLQAD